MSIPPLHCSFPRYNHPDAERLKKECDAWIMARFGHLRSSSSSSAFSAEAFIASGFDVFTMLTFANGLPCRMLPILKYVAWLFMCDSFLDNPLLVGVDLAAADALFSASSSVLHDPSFQYPGDHPIIQAIIDAQREWWLEIRQGTSSLQQARFAAYLKDFLVASRRQIEYRVSSRIPDVATFLRLRVDAGGWYTCAVLAEYALNIEFEEETVAHPLVSALHEAVANHLDWVNDLLSFKKEYLQGDLLNLVAVMYAQKEEEEEEEEGERRLEGVVKEVCGMIKECDEECVRVMAAITASQELMRKAGMAGYLQALANWMSGSLYWHMTSDRYIWHP